MEFTIKKILSIDKDTEMLKKNSDILLESKRRELEDELQKMSDDLDAELLLEKKRVLDESMSTARLEAENIKMQKEIEMNGITARYKSVKNDLIQHLFAKLKDSIKER